MSTSLRRATIQPTKYGSATDLGSRRASPSFQEISDHERGTPLRYPPYPANAERPGIFAIISMWSALARHHMKLTVAIMVLMIAVAALGVTRIKDKYSATTLLVLDQQSARLLDPKAPPPLNADGEVEILKSDSVSLRALERLAPALPPELSPQPGRLSKIMAPITNAVSAQVESIKDLFGLNKTFDALSDPSLSQAGLPQLDAEVDSVLSTPIPPARAAELQALKQRVTIRRRGLTDVIAIEVTAADPVRAAQMANAYAAAYLDEQVTTKLKAIERAESLLSRQLSSLDEELKHAGTQIGLRQLYQDTQNRLKAVTQQRDTVSPDARIVSIALPPRGAKFPGARLLAAIAMLASVVVSFGFAIGAAYLRESRFRPVRSEEELERAVGVRTLASIPTEAKLRNNGRLDGTTGWSPSYTDAIRRLYFNLQLSENRGPKLGIVLITSTVYSEGKTTLALSLARFAASAGSRVAIVDCDLQRPALHQSLGLKSGPGWVDVLTETADPSAIFQTDSLSGCKVITAGHAGGMPSERLLASGRITDTLRKLGSDFDLVVLDAPPMELDTEVQVLLGGATTALYVVKAGEAELAEVQSNLRELDRAVDVKIFTVLNCK